MRLLILHTMDTDEQTINELAGIFIFLLEIDSNATEMKWKEEKKRTKQQHLKRWPSPHNSKIYNNNNSISLCFVRICFQINYKLLNETILLCIFISGWEANKRRIEAWPKNNNEKYWIWQIRIDIWLIARIQFRIWIQSSNTEHVKNQLKRNQNWIYNFCSLRIIIIIDDRLGKYRNIHIPARTDHIVNSLHNLFVCAFNWALNQWSINIDLYKSHRLFSTSYSSSSGSFSSSPYPALDCECKRIRYSSLERCTFRFEWNNPHLPFFPSSSSMHMI